LVEKPAIPCSQGDVSTWVRGRPKCRKVMRYRHEGNCYRRRGAPRLLVVLNGEFFDAILTESETPWNSTGIPHNLLPTGLETFWTE
jgi:hypothetical protein